MVIKLIHVYAAYGTSLCGCSRKHASVKTEVPDVEWCVVCRDLMVNDPPPVYLLRVRPLSVLI